MKKSPEQWITKNVKSQAGVTVIVTGANTGLGFETALALYQVDANVIVACRDKDRGMKAIEKMKKYKSSGSLEVGILDLSDLKKVEQFANKFKENHDKLDLLINNAGVMTPPPSKTQDGLELQFGVNFLGHFALTGHLFECLNRSSNARVVTLSSIAHRGANIDFNNLRLEKEYDKWREYGQSKLACLMFTLELQKRIEKIGSSVISLGSHPGISATELTRHMEDEAVGNIEFMGALQGALPTILAATSPKSKGGEYYGPDGPDEKSGYPAIAGFDKIALDDTIAARLWNEAQEITNLVYP